MRRKILEIDSCFDYPHCDSRFATPQCDKIGRHLRSRFGRIPVDCPLEDAPKEKRSKRP